MASWLYMWKASGLQRYIFATPRLRDVIGASQLIEDLTSATFEQTLDALGYVSGRDLDVVQASAGALTLVFEDHDAMVRFGQHFAVIVRLSAPALTTSSCAVEVTGSLFDAMQRGWDELRAARNRPGATIPAAAPCALRARATGEPAVKSDRNNELIDEATRQARAVNAQNRGAAGGLDVQDVDEAWAGAQWALDMEDIAGRDGYLAIVHADGNRFGKLLIALGAALRGDADVDLVALYRDLSESLARITRGAVIDALRDCELELADTSVSGREHQIVPARPVVLGGDDVTILLRAEHAMVFTSRFLDAFTKHSRDVFGELARRHAPIRRALGARHELTACAGIIFQSRNQPLVAGVESCEALCRFAKNHAAGEDYTHPAYMFARQLDYTDGDLRARLDRDLFDPNTEMLLGAGPYVVGAPARDLATHEELEQVTRLLGSRYIGRGGVRGVIDAMHTSRSEALRLFERVVQIGRADGRALQRTCERIEDASRTHRRLHSAHDADNKPEGACALSILPDAALLHSILSPDPRF